jgi:hypothetical protein
VASWAVVHWFATTTSGTPTFAELNTLVDLIAVKFGTRFIHTGHTSDVTHFTAVKATYELPDDSGDYRTVRVADYVGEDSTVSEAAQVAYLVNWVVADRRRGGKPRSYIPGVPVEVVDQESQVSLAQVANVTNAANGYLSDVNALTSGPFTELHMIDASFVNGKDYRNAALGFPIQAGYCSGTVASQRRRVDRQRT